MAYIHVYHVPVMLEEVIQGLCIQKGKKYIDATIGSGGHSLEIVKRGGVLLGIDQDPEAIKIAEEELRSKNGASRIENETKLVHGNFADIEWIAKDKGFEQVDGILFDLGVSSMQLDTPERGFSYRFTDAPLDLRFDQTKDQTAADLIAKSSEVELYEFFARFGETEHARTIAHRIVRARTVTPIQTVKDIVLVISKDKRIDYGTLSQVFQALRIAVNDELSSLKEGLAGAVRVLAEGGRIVVISFHSLEDRIVKQAFLGSGWRIVTKKPMVPTREEIMKNPRARSAKLRIAEKL